MRPRFRLVALDMDGTLLNDRFELTERTARAVRAAVAAGVRCVFATGRPYCAARPYALALGLDVPLICHNGALVRDAGSGAERLRQPIPLAVAAAVAGFLEDEGLYVKVYAADTLLVRQPTEETAYFARHYGVSYRAVGPLAAFLSGATEVTAAGGRREDDPVCPEPPWMMALYAEPDRLPSLMAELERRWACDIACCRPSPWAIDIVCRGVSKGQALRHLAAAWGVRREEVIAVGNAGNDLDMIAWAGCGVAMANATAELRAIADWVSADNNSDGVALALERFLLE